MTAYAQYNAKTMSDYIPSDEELAKGFATIPDVAVNR
jgi:tryptophan synthase beta chain